MKLAKNHGFPKLSILTSLPHVTNRYVVRETLLRPQRITTRPAKSDAGHPVRSFQIKAMISSQHPLLITAMAQQGKWFRPQIKARCSCTTMIKAMGFDRPNSLIKAMNLSQQTGRPTSHLCFVIPSIFMQNLSTTSHYRRRGFILAAARRPSFSHYYRHPFVPSRKKTNQLLHALNGNHTCRTCQCSLIDRSFPNLPKVFKTTPLCLGNGMMVHKFYRCSNHLSLWYYRRRERRYGVYYGNKAQNLYSHICAARAARGAPGDHGIAKHLFRNFFGLHSSINRTNILASGHESRCASEDERSHQILRSTEAMLRRQASYSTARRESRQKYRQWLASSLETGKFTLARFRSPLKRVQNSPIQIRRSYSELCNRPTAGSRAFLFRQYVDISLLDLPRRLLSFRPSTNELTVATWNVETLIGLGKHESLARFAKQHGIDIILLQENKSQSSDELRISGGKILLAGTPTEPMAGVGFYISPHILPLVEDFLPYSGRLAVLTLRTQPLRTHLISTYAPSQLQDQQSDQVRKKVFWEQMESLDTHLQRPSHIFYAGDFNARILSPELDQMTTHIGPAVFPSPGDLNTIEGSNYGKLLEFIMSKDYCIVSTFFSETKQPHNYVQGNLSRG